jgi:DNA polymerase-3 subunit alpha
VILDYRRPGARGRLICGDDWRVQPADALLKRLRRVLGPDRVSVAYDRGALPPAPASARPPPRLSLVR